MDEMIFAFCDLSSDGEVLERMSNPLIIPTDSVENDDSSGGGGNIKYKNPFMEVDRKWLVIKYKQINHSRCE